MPGLTVFLLILAVTVSPSGNIVSAVLLHSLGKGTEE